MPAMKASILPDRNAPLVVEEVTLDAPKTGEVLVRIAACGVCHSDLSVIDGTLPLPTPIVLGHAGAGVVEAVGPGSPGAPCAAAAHTASAASPTSAIWRAG